MNSTHSQTDLDMTIHETVTESHATIRSCYIDIQAKSVPQSWDQNADPETGHNSEQKYMQRLEKIMYGLNMSMAVFGIYHMNEDKKSPGKPRRLILRNLYHIIVLTFLWLHTSRMILSFFVGEKSFDYMIIRIMMMTWFIQVVLNTTLMIKASHPRFGNQSKACQLWWSEVMPLLKSLNVEMNLKSVSRRVILCLVIGWLTILGNCLATSYVAFFEGTTLYEIMPHIMIAPLPINIITRSSLVVISVYGSVAWILPQMFVISTCIIMRAAFKASSVSLQEAIDSRHDRTEYPRCLYRQRMLHLNISKMVTFLDKDFQHFFGNWFGTNIPLACFMIYQILKSGDMDLFTLSAYTCWLMSTTLILVFSAAFAASTNDAVST